MPSNPPKDVAVVLLELTQRLSKSGPLEESLTAVTDAALELLPCDHASIRLLDATRTQLLAGARSGAGTERGTLPLKKGEGIAGWVFEHTMPARVDDARTDSRFMVAVGQGFRIGSMLGEPLLAGGKVIGVLSVSSPTPGAFSDRDVLLARLLANCSVPPIERARLERLAVTDELTLAFSAKYLAPRLHEEVERAKIADSALTVLFCDLDRFRHVNSSYGQGVGDRVLAIVADRMRGVARRFDVLVRTGGDEFALLLPGTAEDDAEAFATKLAAQIADPAMEPMPGGFITQSVTIGAATWDRRESADDLAARARGDLAQRKRAREP